MRFLKLLYCTLVQRAQIVTFKGCSDTFQGAPETFEKQVGSFLHFSRNSIVESLKNVKTRENYQI